jgi:hypothetical protein
MIIAHELGHIQAGHLVWHWLLLPSSLVPFLGAALSRAREYTCDRFGLAGAGDKNGALKGLTILAAGARYGPRVNREALVAQRASLNNGWMTLGEWMSTHPPLSKRLAALDPALIGSAPRTYRAGALQAAAAIFLVVALPIGIAGAFIAADFTGMLEKLSATASAGAEGTDSAWVRPPLDSALLIARTDLAALTELIEEQRAVRGVLPWDEDELYDAWAAKHPDAREPRDPFDGQRYGYRTRDAQYQLWSTGPDGSSFTADDVAYDSRVRRP